MKKRTLYTIFDYPELAKHLNMEANLSHGIDPYKTYVSMCTPLYFKTPNNITFKRDAKSAVRVYLKYGQRPYETKATITGYNDIETLCPEIKELWDFERNEKIGLDLKKLSTRSGLKAYFKCSNCGKPIDELRYIFSVTEHNSVFCNKCNKSIKTSIQEQTLYYYVKKLVDNAINGYKGLNYNNYELDIFLPDFNIGIEYDGRKWHKDKKDTDLIKYNQW